MGVGGSLVSRQIRKMSAAIQAFIKLPAMCEGMSRAVNTQTVALAELNRRQDVILEQNRRLFVVLELNGGMD